MRISPNLLLCLRNIRIRWVGKGFPIPAQGAARPQSAEAFLSIKNVFNTDPAPVASGPDGNNIPAYPMTNRNLYDYLGRVYRIGMRVRM